MNTKAKRWMLVGLAAVALAAAGLFAFQAFQENLVFFYSPSQIAAGEAPKGRAFRVGGMVTKGSVKRQDDGVTVAFAIDDSAESVPVVYKGILPDLFKEGTGVVAQGKLDDSGVFQATQVLAKHDENYMPPEAASAMQAAKDKKAKEETR